MENKVTYKLIAQDTADKIKEILENTGLFKLINMVVDEFKLEVNNVSENSETEHHKPFEMKEFYLLDDENSYGVLRHKNRLYEIFINIGEWGYKSRLKNTHITLGSSKFHDYCFQIELSQAISDEKYIYIIKNVSNMAGEGALCRLYRGLKGNRDEKLKRQELFIEKYNSEIISYKNKDWVVISKIKIEDLYNDDEAENIFYNLIYNILFAMLLVENIGEK